MKRIALGAAMAVLAGPAFAADPVIYEPAPAAAPVATVYDWSGLYVGLEAGYGWGDSTIDFDDYIVPLDPDGWLGGVYAGYNLQLPSRIVIGIEGDFTFSGMDSSDVLGIDSGIPDPDHRYYSDLKWMASIRGRLGFAFDRFLPFVTGGVAFARYEHGETLLNPFSVSDTYTGWTIGAGAEYAVTSNFIVRAQYRYSDFGSERFDDVPGWSIHTVDLKTHDVRIGISYKF